MKIQLPDLGGEEISSAKFWFNATDPIIDGSINVSVHVLLNEIWNPIWSAGDLEDISLGTPVATILVDDSDNYSATVTSNIQEAYANELTEVTVALAIPGSGAVSKNTQMYLGSGNNSWVILSNYSHFEITHSAESTVVAMSAGVVV
jgi:hypothetical protein